MAPKRRTGRTPAIRGTLVASIATPFCFAYLRTNEQTQGHHKPFPDRLEPLYGRLVDLSDQHNGSAKIHSPLRDDDDTPSFLITLNGEYGGRWRDFGTGEHGDAFEFFKRMRGLSTFPEVLDAIQSEFKITAASNGTKPPKLIRSLGERGIDGATAAAFRIEEHPGDRKLTRKIVFPVLDREGELLGFKTHKGRHLKPDKTAAQKGGGIRPQLYPWKALTQGEIFVVNGEPSVWRSWTAGYRNVVCSTGGEGSFKPEWAELFREKTVKLVLDNDASGRKGNDKTGAALKGVTQNVVVMQWPEGWKKGGDVEDLLNDGHKLEDLEFLEWAPAKTPTTEPDVDQEKSLYEVRSYAIGYWKTVGRGDDTSLMFVQLANFDVRVTQEVARDDGVEITKRFTIEGKLQNGFRLPTADVAASEFAGLAWVVNDWGVKARISAGPASKDRLREAIQYLSADVAERTIYTHLGWWNIDGRWLFLHAGGAIGAHNVEVDVEAPLDRYSLPGEPDELAGAIEHSLSLLDVAASSVTVPLLSCIALAPLSEILRPDFALWLFGVTGSMKSTLAALFLSHFGEFSDKNTLPGSWESTENSLERRLFTLKDVPAVIDDYAPKTDASAQARMTRIVQRVIRAQGNLSGRDRMRSDTTLRPSYPPRGLLISTGEDLPQGESILARLLSVQVDRSEIGVAALTRAQHSAARLPHAMSGYIHWLAPRMDELKESLPDEWKQRRVDATKGAPHLRMPEVTAFLATGSQYLSEIRHRCRGDRRRSCHP